MSLLTMVRFLLFEADGRSRRDTRYCAAKASKFAEWVLGEPGWRAEDH